MDKNLICAVFDMDGTLADTSLITIPACIQAAGEYNCEAPTPEAIQGAIGIGGLDFYRRLFPSFDDAKLEEIAERIFELEKENTRKLGAGLLFPGIAELLNKLTEMGTTLAIASTGETAHVESILGSTGIKPLFASIKCNSNNKAAMLEELLNEYKNHTLYMIGDKPKDSDSARANGIYSIGVGYGFSTDEELAGFDTVAGSPGEMLDIIY